MKRTELASFLTYLCLFLLPWQTVWIYDSINPSPLSPLPGGEGEYWKLTHYAVQLLIVIVVCIRWEIKKNEAAKKIMNSLWWFFAAMIFVSFFSVNWYLSGGFLFHLFSALLLFWLLLDERIEARKIIWFFSLGLIVPCLLGWWQVLVGSSPASTVFGLSEHLVATPGTSVVEMVGDRLMRAYGSFPHPNIFGGYLAAGILAIIGATRSYVGARHLSPEALAKGDGAPQRTVRSVILILLSSTLVITFSRSAWLALVVGIILFFIASVIYKIKIPRNFLKGLIVASVAAVASVAIFHSAVFTRVSATDRLETKSLTERQSEYQMIGEVIKINPFVGVGPGAYTVALAEKFPGHDIWFYQPMHNSFLLFFAETGLLGLVFLGWVLGVVFAWCGQCDRRGERPFAPTTVPIIITLLIIGIFDHYLWSQWAGLALLVVILAIFVKRSD